MNGEIWKKILSKRTFRGEIRFNEAMAKHTSFKIGGPAEVMVFPKDVLDLRMVLTMAKTNRVPVFILGMGTNILVSDEGVQGITVNLKNLNRIKIVDSLVYAEAGIPLQKLLSFTAKHGFEGFEFIAGIPGTLGGAIVMNAGIKQKEMKDVVDRVILMNRDGVSSIIKREEIPFGYRKSGIEGIVVGASFKLNKGDTQEINERIKDHIMERSFREPAGLPNAGSIFKNPVNGAAGRIIEELGLKGLKIGDAEVSPIHANYIVNKGRAKASDVISLMRVIEESVFKERGIVLEPEIKIVGEDETVFAGGIGNKISSRSRCASGLCSSE